MKLALSMFSQSRSFIGFEIGRGGYPTVNENGEPVVQRQIEVSIGFLFGWLTIGIDWGGQFRMKDVFDDILKSVDKAETRNK